MQVERPRETSPIEDDAASAPDRAPSVLSKSTRILDAVWRSGGRCSLPQLVLATGISKSSAHRIALELTALGVLVRTERGYEFGLKLFEWAQVSAWSELLRTVALPVMEEAARVGPLVVRLSMLDGDHVLFLATVGNQYVSPSPPERGSGSLPTQRLRLPANATSSGKVLLAYADGQRAAPLTRLTPHTITDPEVLAGQLAEVRSRGWAVEYEEARPGVCSVAAPVVVHGRAMYALSIAGKVGAIRPVDLAPLAQRAAQQAAGRILRSGLAASALWRQQAEAGEAIPVSSVNFRPHENRTGSSQVNVESLKAVEQRARNHARNE